MTNKYGSFRKYDSSYRHLRIERVITDGAAEFSYKVDIYNDLGTRFCPINMNGFSSPVVNALTDWCMDHLDLDDWTYLSRTVDQTYDFEFANEAIALAFKLRWHAVVFERPFG